MKQYLLVSFLLLATHFMAVEVAAQNKQHKSVSPTTELVDTTDQGLEAYSDTGSVITSQAADSANVVAVTYPSHRTWDDIDNPLDFFVVLEHLGWVGVLLAIIITFLVVLFALAPFIIIGLLIYWMIKRHNDKVRLAERAMMTGQPILSDVTPSSVSSDEMLWRKGIKNTALGLGLVFLFYFLSADPLVGIGWLVVCCGVGQMVMARSSFGKKDKNQEF